MQYEKEAIYLKNHCKQITVIMKKLLIVLMLLVPGLLIAQQTIQTYEMGDEAARTKINANFTNDNTVPYLEMAFSDSAETIAATEDIWAIIANEDSTLWTATAARVTSAGDTATISVAGDYVGMFQVDYTASADDTIHIRVVKNDSTALTPKATALSIGAEIINLSTSYLFPNLAIGDDLKPQIQNSNNGDDPVVINGSFLLYLIRYD